MNIGVIGATGLLGGWILPILKEEYDRVYSIGRSPSCDVQWLPEKTRLNDLLIPLNLDYVINLIALTNVDYCEAHVGESYFVNALIVREIAESAKKNNIRLIHISTDHLYDKVGVNQECEIVIRNVYALTKLCGEQEAIKADAVILRTNFFGKSLVNKPSFTDWLFRSGHERIPINLYSDIFFSPVHWYSLWNAIAACIQSFQPGIYNFGSRSVLSKADFGIMLYKEFKLDLQPVNIISKPNDSSVVRPRGMGMDSTLFKKTFGISAGSLEDEILILRREYNA